MARYRFITAVSLAALEQDLNRAAADDASLDLVQVLHVPGTGFVAVVEVEDGEGDGDDDTDAGSRDAARRRADEAVNGVRRTGR